MKKLFTVFAILALPLFTLAEGLNYTSDGPTMDDVRTMRAEISPFLGSLKGVMGNGIFRFR
jgi:hypothetical protein